MCKCREVSDSISITFEELKVIQHGGAGNRERME